jgi:hypothetical protein
MMKIFQKFSKNLAISVFGICLWANAANATFSDHASVGIDNAGTAVAIWRQVDPDTDNHEYRGSVGNGPSFILTTISDPTAVEGSTPPVLAVAKGTTTTTVAAAAWTAIGLTSDNSIVQVVTATSSGWSASPILLSLDDGTEVPQNDHRIDISANGQTITVTWSSFFPGSGENIIRFAVSTDGGSTFTTSDLSM